MAAVGSAVLAVSQMIRTVHVLERALQAAGSTPGPWPALLTSHALTQELALSPEPDRLPGDNIRTGRSRSRPAARDALM